MNPNDDGELMQATKDNLVKFSSNLNGELKVGVSRGQQLVVD
jgi:transformation/transcription domain-associated protein